MCRHGIQTDVFEVKEEVDMNFFSEVDGGCAFLR